MAIDLSPSEYERLHRSTELVYSDEEIFSCYREAANGGRLSRTLYEEYRQGKTFPDGRPWPSFQLGHLRFGSWVAAVEAAGVRAYSRPQGGQRRKFSNAQVLTAIRSANRRSQKADGRLLTASRYDSYARDTENYPSLSLLRMRFGSWSKALRLALDLDK